MFELAFELNFELYFELQEKITMIYRLRGGLQWYITMPFSSHVIYVVFGWSSLTSCYSSYTFIRLLPPSSSRVVSSEF